MFSANLMFDLELVSKNPSIKQRELAAATETSLSTVKRIMKSLQKNSISAEKAAEDTASVKYWVNL